MTRRRAVPPGPAADRPAAGGPADPDPAAVDPDLDPGARRERRQFDVLAVVALGGGLGSVARYLLGQAWPARPGGFPWATFTINVTGCALLGALMVFVVQVWPPRRYVRTFLGVGVCGGFTTFSTYTMEIRDLAAGGHWASADAYAAGTLVAALAAVWAGMLAARLATRRTTP